LWDDTSARDLKVDGAGAEPRRIIFWKIYCTVRTTPAITTLIFDFLLCFRVSWRIGRPGWYWKYGFEQSLEYVVMMIRGARDPDQLPLSAWCTCISAGKKLPPGHGIVDGNHDRGPGPSPYTKPAPNLHQPHKPTNQRMRNGSTTTK
jgi:hypothetical protein